MTGPIKPVSRWFIGPYPEHMIRDMTETMINSLPVYVLLESILRGHRDDQETFQRIQGLAEIEYERIKHASGPEGLNKGEKK